MLLHYSIYVVYMILLAFSIHINAIIKAITYELREHSEKRLVANTISYKPISLFLSSFPIKGIDKMQKGRQSMNSWALNYSISDRDDGAIKTIKKGTTMFNDVYKFLAFCIILCGIHRTKSSCTKNITSVFK